MSTDPNRLERRGAQRFEVHLPLAVHFEGRTVPGFTQDLSGRGIFFYAETALPAGAVVELTFTMPSEITLARKHAGPLSRTCVARFLVPGLASETGSPCNSIPTSTCPPIEPVSQFVRVSAAGAAGASSGADTALRIRFSAVFAKSCLAHLFKLWLLPYNQSQPAAWRDFSACIETRRQPAASSVVSLRLRRSFGPERWKFVA